MFSDININTNTLELIKKWGRDKGITVNGTYHGQWLKLMSEFGEFCDNTAKGKDVKDDIGDMFVVLVMLCGLKSVDIHEACRIAQTFTDSSFDDELVGLGFHFIHMHEDFSEMNVSEAVEYLAELALRSNTTLAECIEIAYNDIKDRKGYLNAEGVFIKEQP